MNRHGGYYSFILAASISGKHNATVWCLLVCLSVLLRNILKLTHQGQHPTQPEQVSFHCSRTDTALLFNPPGLPVERTIYSAAVFLFFYNGPTCRPIISGCTQSIITKFSGLVDIWVQINHLTLFRSLKGRTLVWQPNLEPNRRNLRTPSSLSHGRSKTDWKISALMREDSMAMISIHLIVIW